MKCGFLEVPLRNQCHALHLRKYFRAHRQRARVSDVGGEINIIGRALPDLRAEFT
jgi:hypothetical protein